MVSKHLKKTGNNASDKSLRIFKLLTVVIIIIGLFFLYEASVSLGAARFDNKFHFIATQVRWLILGLIFAVISSRIKISKLKEYALPIMMFTIILLVAVLIPGIGGKYLGARRWIEIFGQSIQPSEFAKLAVCVYFAKLAEKKKSLPAFIFAFLITSFLVILQPDMGTVMVISMIAFVQLFITGINIKKLAILGSIGLFISVLMIISSPYRRDRLFTYFQRTGDPLGQGYHIRQILIAFGQGGMWGVGIGNSRQRNLYLPEAPTDSVFAITAEELGFAKTSLIILTMLVYILFSIKCAMVITDQFEKVLAFGIIAWISSQILINLASITAIIPITGVPLPFFSYGGSSIIALLIGIGVFINLSDRAYK